ncbi:MAG: hypothetical protein ABW049_00780 [Spongiibacteraceae bacterium]
MSIPSQFRVEKISPDRLLTIGVNVLHRAFHDGPRLDAKRRYQFIMERQPVYLLNMTMDTGGEVRVVMSLERSELRGRLNFSLFRQLIAQLLVNYTEALNAGKPLNVFTDGQNRRWVFLHPAFCNTAEGVNALVLAMDMGRAGELRIELMFLDPQQFIKKEAS